MKAAPDKPPILYQYRPPEAWALGNLCRRVLYLSAPAGFNDPYEWRISPRFDDMTPEEIAAFFEKRDIKPHEGESHNERIRRLNKAAEIAFDNWRHGCGIACLSECKNSILMWSHYADRNRGFCLAFDSGFQCDKNDILVKVEYSQECPSVTFSHTEKSDGEKGEEILARKSEPWAYEKEWRLIRKYEFDRDKNFRPPINRERRYSPKALKAVYLGAEMEPGIRKFIYGIVRAIYPHTELWQVRINKRKYELRARPLNNLARRHMKEAKATGATIALSDTG